MPLYTCQIIKNQLIPALELDNGESKELSLNTLQKLISEKRPPKDDSEINDLENAAFFKIVYDTQNGTKSTHQDGQFLKSKNTSILELQKQYKGRKFGELILHQLKVQNSNHIKNAVAGLKEKVHPALLDTTEKFLVTIIYSYAKSSKFWTMDCGEALILYTNSTKAEAQKFNIEIDDDYAFDIFNLIVLSLAKQALENTDFKSFIKKSVKKFWFF